MSVRAKFNVTTKIQNESNLFTVKLHPVTTGSEENEQFFKYTPGGEVSLYVVSEAVANQFEIGSSYYIDFTKAE